MTWDHLNERVGNLRQARLKVCQSLVASRFLTPVWTLHHVCLQWMAWLCFSTAFDQRMSAKKLPKSCFKLLLIPVLIVTVLVIMVGDLSVRVFGRAVSVHGIYWGHVCDNIGDICTQLQPWYLSETCCSDELFYCSETIYFSRVVSQERSCLWRRFTVLWVMFAHIEEVNVFLWIHSAC